MVHEWFLDGLADWKVTKKGMFRLKSGLTIMACFGPAQ